MKDRHPDLFNRLRGEYLAWDKATLPLDCNAATSGSTGRTLADHDGIRNEETINPLSED